MTDKQKQHLLGYLGYYAGVPDGIWGRLSEEATRAFQRAYNLEPDGVFGAETEKRIRAVIGTGEEPSGDPQGWWREIRYFTRNEFRCPCGKCGGFPAEPDETMVRVVDEIRHRAGVPVTIVDSGGSGIRCPEHNAEVGGVPNSEHKYGRAADLHSQLPPAELYRIAEKVTAELIPGRGGIGLYSWGIHVDVGKYSRWNG